MKAIKWSDKNGLRFLITVCFCSPFVTITMANQGWAGDKLSWPMFLPAITSNNNPPIDCNGDVRGTASVDMCNNCVEGNTGADPCKQDCKGDWGGSKIVDVCGRCGGPGGPCNADCNSTPQTAMWKGLEWQRCDNVMDPDYVDKFPYLISHDQAQSFCENLVLNGHNDWRLPSRSELSSLVYCSNGNDVDLYDGCVPFGEPIDYDIPTIDPQFESLSKAYWTNTAFLARPDCPFGECNYQVSFYYGGSHQQLNEANRAVRCVR